MSTKTQRTHRDSFRWRTSRHVDVDAFHLDGGAWFLFATVKSEELAARPGFLEGLAGEFGRHVEIGGALKTENVSRPLPPVGGPGKEVWALERKLKFRLETSGVLNPGLFLDQALNRARLAELVHTAAGADPEHCRLLNLFSYTGSFSVAAAAAGALFTTSVDLSARYLHWAEKNHSANAVAEENACGRPPLHRHIRDDARAFLRRELKRGVGYRWIVVDPPTFSRAHGKVFHVERELVPMLEAAVRLLLPGGAILVSTNDAAWSPREFRRAIGNFAREHRLEVEPGKTPPEFGSDHPLKSAWLHRAASRR